jgi:hypothetical protein
MLAVKDVGMVNEAGPGRLGDLLEADGRGGGRGLSCRGWSLGREGGGEEEKDE